MSLAFVLLQFGQKVGLNPSDTGQRAVLLRFANEAAREIYTQFDPADSLQECIFQVNGNQEVALPSYVGEIRAAREIDTQIAWHINRPRPHYNEINWQDMWRNYRIKGLSPILQSVKNQSIVTVTVALVETPPIVVSITGSTSNATSITENLTMDALSKSTSNDFLDITAIKKNKVNTVDVTVKDVDNNVLSIIPNNNIQSKYQLIDVSAFPFSTYSVSYPQGNYLEFLYKKALPTFSNDGDEFPVLGYDDAWVNKCCQLYYEEQNDGLEKAIAYDAKATRTMARLQEDRNSETEDMISLVRNPHDTIFPRISSRRRRGYGRLFRY